MWNQFKTSYFELRQKKCYSVCFILYVILEFSIGIEFIQRCANIRRSEAVKAYEGYPADCTDFTQNACIRTDLKIDECRGVQNNNEPLVYEATLGQVGYTLAECVDETTKGFDYGVQTLEPVFDLCDYKSTRTFNEALQKTNLDKL